MKKTRKKIKGGAKGLVLNIMYNDNDEIIDIKVQDLLARNAYIKKHGFDPKTPLTWNSIKKNIFEPISNDVFESANNFFYGKNPANNQTKKKYIRFAVNNKNDVRLVHIANKIIKVLNKTKNADPNPIVVTRNFRGKIDSKCKEEIESKYDRILREHERRFLEEVSNPKDKEVAKVLLRNPFLVNLIGAKFGILKRGDLTLEELEDLFNAYEPTVEHTKSVNVDEIMEEKLQKIRDQNRHLEQQIEKYKIFEISKGDMKPVANPLTKPLTKPLTNPLTNPVTTL